MTHQLIRVETVDILERSRGQFRWEASLQSNRNGCSLFECRIRLRALIFVVIIISDLSRKGSNLCEGNVLVCSRKKRE